MAFHLGKPILAMLAISVVSGALILSRPRPTPSAMTVWVFDESHAKTLRDDLPNRPSLVRQFHQSTGLSVRVTQVSPRAEDVRLISLFNNDSPNVPDLVEMEIGMVGKFFLPPPDRVGFLPLNEFIKRDGLMHKLVPARFAPWSKGGVIYGIPHDLHPVTLTYRKDLFDAAGVDLESAKTWREFHDACLRFQGYWKARGVLGRMAIELPAAQPSNLSMMLLQRGVNLVDSDNKIHLNEPIVAETVSAYAQMVAGPKRIGADTQERGNLWARDFSQGTICALFTPDWRISALRSYAPQVAGQVRMMPLPRFAPTDAATSTWGGTMIGIPRRCKDPEASWKLLKFLYLSDEALAARWQFTDILPPTQSMPSPHSDSFFAGQDIRGLYASLASQVPARYQTPFTVLASELLGIVQYKAARHVERFGSAGLVEACQRWLDEAARDLEDRIKFGTFQ